MALSLMLGCGAGAETEAETSGDPVLVPVAGASGSAGAVGSAARAGTGAAGASAAVSGGSMQGAARGSAGSAAVSGGAMLMNGLALAGSAGATSTGGAGGVGGVGGANTVDGSSAAGTGGGGHAGSASSGSSGAGPAQAGSAGSAAMSAPAAGSGGMAAASNAPLRVYIASDSTASNYKDTGSDKDQAGWGQMLPELVKPNAKVDNRAIGGRTARRFIDEGRLDEIWKDIHDGDYLLVQFGTNDGNKTASYELNGQQIPYYLDPATDFKTYIKKYIEGAQQHGAIAVLVTPPPRNSAYCTGGNGTGAHAQALRELAESEQVLVVDLNKMAVDYLTAICPEPNPPNFFLQKPDGSIDGTHFQKAGARKLASFVAEALRAHMVSWIKD